MLALIIIILAVAIDQITKYLALTLLAPVKAFVIIDGVLELNFVRNRGAAWGMLADNRWVFMIISSVSIVLILIYIFTQKSDSKLFNVSLALIAGGGIGNMIDRIFYEEGAVVDFIYFKLIDFPVFNFADCCVTVGAGLLIFYLLVYEIIKPMRQKKIKGDADEKTDLQ